MVTYQKITTETVEITNEDLEIHFRLITVNDGYGGASKKLEARMIVTLQRSDGTEIFLDAADLVENIGGVNLLGTQSTLITIRNHLLAELGLSQI